MLYYVDPVAPGRAIVRWRAPEGDGVAIVEWEKVPGRWRCVRCRSPLCEHAMAAAKENLSGDAR